MKITRLAAEPNALLVEAHFVYVEPLEWFQGNPILRSKFGVIAQDQIRRLRREIAKKRRPAESVRSTDSKFQRPSDTGIRPKGD